MMPEIQREPSNGRRIKLEWYEQVTAGVIGVLRRVESLRHGLTHNPPRPELEEKYGHLMARDIEAAGAEVAAARMIGRYWYAGVNQWDQCDVWPDVEVRWTEYKGGRLLLQKKDKPDSPYVLVVGKFPDYEIVGWIRGRDGQREDWWKSRGRLLVARFAMWYRAKHFVRTSQ